MAEIPEVEVDYSRLPDRELTPSDKQAFESAESRIKVIRAQFRDIVDEDGNILEPEPGTVDGDTRAIAMGYDARRLSRKGLLAARAAIDRDVDRVEQKRARFVAYRNALQNVVSDLTRAIEEAEAELEGAAADEG